MSASSSDDENVRVGIMEGLKSIEEMLNDAQIAVKKLMAVQRRVRSADEMGPELQGVLGKATHISSTLREMLGEVEEGERGVDGVSEGRKKNAVQPLSQLQRPLVPPVRNDTSQSNFVIKTCIRLLSFCRHHSVLATSIRKLSYVEENH